MKILKKIVFYTLFIFCISSNVVFAQTGKVNIEATRIRKEANTTSEIITVIYEDDEVEILEESGDWYKVKYKNDTGYVKKDYITENKQKQSANVTSNTSDKTNTTKQTNATNVSNTVNATNSTEVTSNNQDKIPADESTLTINSETFLKVLPSFTSNNILKLEVSKQVKKISELNNWIQVSNGEVTGWILQAKVQTNNTVQEQTTNDKETTENKTNTITNNTTSSNTVSNTISNTVTNSTTNTTSSGVAGASNKKAIVNVETAKVRELASTNSEVIGFLDYGDEITLLEQDGDWYKINFEGKTGYIKNTLIKISNDSVSSRSLPEERIEDTTNKAQENETVTKKTNGTDVVNYAKQFLGFPYVSGGKNPSTGFDCSGFTKYVYSNFGYTLNATSSSQVNSGIEVTRENLLPGDLILFLGADKNGIGHTGIYIGDGVFIHAANPQRGVVTDNFNTNTYYNERFVTARRIIN